MDYAMITKALEQAVGAVVKFRETVEETTAGLEDILWTVYETVEEFNAKQTQSADEAQPSQEEFNRPTLTLEEKLDFVLKNVEQTETVKSIRNNARIQEQMIRDSYLWIEQQYERLYNRPTKSCDDDFNW